MNSKVLNEVELKKIKETAEKLSEKLTENGMVQIKKELAI